MRRTLFELIVIVIVIARMTRNDHPNKLELSIRPHSGVDSAQWDWGISTTLSGTKWDIQDLPDKPGQMGLESWLFDKELF